ncbi:MAG: Flp pilus assembly protein CpaB [Noviherbaspirillum sp.]
MKLPIPRNFKPQKTWIVLGVALGVGLLAALVAYSYLSNQMAAIEARARGETVPVVVAKSDLPKGATLSTENVAIRPVPKDFAHSVAVTPEQFGRIEGQALAYPVKGGEMILWGLMESKKAPTFSARVETGHRAMTVPVDEINSISGMVEPGDIIDLLVTIDRKSKKITFPLLQSAQVMATGQRSVDDPKSGERRSYSTVTLDTTPEQAQHVIAAREMGRITALLRNPQDKRPMPNAHGDVAVLLGLKDDAGGIAGEERQIPVLYGGGSGKLPAEGLQLGRYAEASPPTPVLQAPGTVNTSTLAVRIPSAQISHADAKVTRN